MGVSAGVFVTVSIGVQKAAGYGDRLCFHQIQRLDSHLTVRSESGESVACPCIVCPCIVFAFAGRGWTTVEISDSAGINRHRVENERVLHRMPSQPR